jgi:Rps23 Pro-64 3,4-dihydroxylase Tpa1-like proline 4-hydroxylase
MSCRSAILIDNFLPEDKFNFLSAKVAASDYYINNQFAETKDDLWKEISSEVLVRLKEIGLYQPHFDGAIELFGYNQFRPPNYGHGNMYGPHIDNGGYVFYVHPHWDKTWEGQLKITHAIEEQYRTGIFPKPNRFIWIDPSTFHDVTSTSTNTSHARVTNIAFLGGEMYVDPVGINFINIFTTD